MINKAIEQYRKDKEVIKNYSYANFVMGYDSYTDCPKQGVEYSLNVQQYFSKQILDILGSDSYKENIFKLYDNRELLDPIMKRDIELEYKSLKKLLNVPKEEMNRHLQNLDDCYFSWVKGRETTDYTEFNKNLNELVKYYKNYTKYQETENIKGYDVLLDEMEDHLTTEKYDEFFNLIEEKIVPLAKKILAKKNIKYNPKLDNLTFPIEGQRKLTIKVANLMGYTNEYGCIRETIHPFTNGVHNKDVRITTSYDEKLLFSNLYSVMHEAGHALYDLNHDAELNETNMFGGASCALHESQSRFYENYLGRRHSFISYLYQMVKEIFPTQLEGITEEDLYYYVNSPKLQMTRTEADELTYPIHILIRYKIEKMLFNDELAVEDISKTFNSLMKEYLLVEPNNDTEGCYQDIHWSSDFGYFPTYALGSAFGAQFFKSMAKDINIDQDLSEGNFQNITKWLKDNIQHYGHMIDNLEIVKRATNEDFNPNYYIDYLLDKYKEF